MIYFTLRLLPYFGSKTPLFPWEISLFLTDFWNVSRAISPLVPWQLIAHFVGTVAFSLKCITDECFQKFNFFCFQICSFTFICQQTTWQGSMTYLPEKWLYNRIYCPSNRSKQIKETHTAYSAGIHNVSGKVWMKNNIHGFTDRQLSAVKPCTLFFIQNFAAYIVYRRYKPCEFPGIVWTDCWGNKTYYVITSPANSLKTPAIILTSLKPWKPSYAWVCSSVLNL